MYKIHSTYCWYGDWTNQCRKIVKMYFINGIPFTHDDIEDLEGVDINQARVIADHETRYN